MAVDDDDDVRAMCVQVTVIIVASPVFTVFLPFLAYAYTWVASMYRASAREVGERAVRVWAVGRRVHHVRCVDGS